jgi:hypothetical protein
MRRVPPRGGAFFAHFLPWMEAASYPYLLLVEWRRIIRTIASRRGQRTRATSSSIDRMIVLSIDRSIDHTRPMRRTGPTNDHCGNLDDDEDDEDAVTNINAVHGPKGSPAYPSAARKNLYVPPQHIVQQGQKILGRRDTQDDQVEKNVRKIGRTGRRLLAVVRFQSKTGFFAIVRQPSECAPTKAFVHAAAAAASSTSNHPRPTSSTLSSANDRPAAVSTATIHDLAPRVP